MSKEVGEFMLFYRKERSKFPIPTPKRDIQPFLPTFDENVTYICEALNHTDDLKVKEITFRKNKGTFLYLQTMADKNEIERSFLHPLKEANKVDDLQEVIVNVDFKISINLKEAVNKLLEGNCVVLVEDIEKMYIFNTPQQNDREFQEPENEKVARGSHQGFIEDLDSNIN